ncbi:MAG: hypothetical protein ABI746_05620 [Dermatophilaceae bacterium]
MDAGGGRVRISLLTRTPPRTRALTPLTWARGLNPAATGIVTCGGGESVREGA